MSWHGQVVITALISALIELLIHYLPWQLIIKRDFSKNMAHFLGIALPITALLSFWSRQWGLYPVPGFTNLPDGAVVKIVIISIWCVLLSAYGSILLANVMDHILRNLRLVEELKELLDARQADQER